MECVSVVRSCLVGGAIRDWWCRVVQAVVLLCGALLPVASLAQGGGCELTNNVTQAATTGVTTSLAWNTELRDDLGAHDTVTQNNTVNIVSDGWYRVSANVGFNTNTTGIRDLFIRKNGTTVWLAIQNATSASTCWMSVSAETYLVAGDTLDVAVFQTSGITLSVLSGGRFSVVSEGDVYLVGIEAGLCILIGFVLVWFPLSKLF